MAPVRPVLPRLLCSNEMVRNAPKYEFWVQWIGSGAFVARNSDATLISELVRYWHEFGQFSIDFSAVTKRSETPQNMSFGSNGVDRLHSLRKIRTRLCLANFCVIAPVRPVLHRLLCSNQTVRNAPKHKFWVQWSGSGAFVPKNCDATLFSELVH
jgi:hypothetical protein